VGSYVAFRPTLDDPTAANLLTKARPGGWRSNFAKLPELLRKQRGAFAASQPNVLLLPSKD
jgi:hypothetical protein